LHYPGVVCNRNRVAHEGVVSPSYLCVLPAEGSVFFG